MHYYEKCGKYGLDFPYLIRIFCVEEIMLLISLETKCPGGSGWLHIFFWRHRVVEWWMHMFAFSGS
jgi:hypothetical protein